jgi:hypothetical protein
VIESQEVGQDIVKPSSIKDIVPTTSEDSPRQDLKTEGDDIPF